jgi:hypothetical protein
MAVTFSGSGQVVAQVKSTVLTTAVSTTSTSFTNATGLSVSITPTNSANKILVFCSLFTGTSNGSVMMWQITRNGTAIDVNTDQTNKATGAWYPDSSSGAAYTFNGNSTTFLDSPSTTSAVTYQIQFLATGGTAYINRRGADTNFGGTSTITVMEISGT